MNAPADVQAVLEGRARWTVVHGDSAELLRSLPDSSVDALVSDPPAGIGFMGRAWDSDKGGRAQWTAWLAGILAECLRVMKPGAHALVWALPRTSHWTATALEDAGFEVRDCVFHLFGTGFPKSLDVSKALDAAAGAERRVLSTMPDRWAGKGTVLQRATQAPRSDASVTAPATELARQWAGWGTALKPAVECWWLARKPLEGTVAATVVRYGTGGLNIDGCRVVTGDAVPTFSRRGEASANVFGGGLHGSNHTGETSSAGRWPANLCLSHASECEDTCAPHCPVRQLDEQSGTLKSGTIEAHHRVLGGSQIGTFQMRERRGENPSYGDSGGASRFFYTSKPSRDERDAECWDLPPRTAGEATARDDGTDGLSSPRAGAGRTGGARNHHPTVKSVELMTWLCRLITPPDGVVLDPFTGSGSTGVAAGREGFRFVGIEREAEYVEIARRRVARVGQVSLLGPLAEPAIGSAP